MAESTGTVRLVLSLEEAAALHRALSHGACATAGMLPQSDPGHDALYRVYEALHGAMISGFRLTPDADPV